MYYYGVGTEKLRGAKRAADIINALKAFFGVDSRKGDEIGRVEGHKHTVLFCLLSYFCKSCFPRGKSVACLIFIGVKPL